IEALLLSAGGRAHYPGKQPHASIEDDHRAELSAGEHIIADRDRLDGPRLEDSLVETLEAAAQQNDAFAGRELAHAGLGQRFPARRQRQHRPPIGNAVERRGEHVGPQHHSSAPARGRIVDATVLVGGEISDVLRLETPDTFVERPASQARTQRTREHVRIERQHCCAERHGVAYYAKYSGSSTIQPDSRSAMPSLNGINARLPLSLSISSRSPAP